MTIATLSWPAATVYIALIAATDIAGGASELIVATSKGGQHS
jgi:hypothetical protein